MTKAKRKAPNGNHRTKVFNVRLETQVLAKLRVLGEQEHRTVTNLVQLFVAEGIAKRATT